MSLHPTIPSQVQSDGGFVISFRNPENETAKDAVNAFANDLAARFDPKVGCTRSWDTSDPSDFTVRVAEVLMLLCSRPKKGLTKFQ